MNSCQPYPAENLLTQLLRSEEVSKNYSLNVERHESHTAIFLSNLSGETELLSTNGKSTPPKRN